MQLRIVFRKRQQADSYWLITLSDGKLQICLPCCARPKIRQACHYVLLCSPRPQELGGKRFFIGSKEVLTSLSIKCVLPALPSHPRAD